MFERWIGRDGNLTPAAAISILAFAVIGAASTPFITWFAKGAYDEFRNQTDKMTKLEIFIAGASERARLRDSRLDAVEAVNRNQQVSIDDHDRRLIRIETSRGFVP